MSKVKFKNMLYDLEFKYIFSHEEILKDFINSYYKYIGEEKEFLLTTIKPQDYIMPDKKCLKSYYGDITAILNTGEIILLEAYLKFGNRECYKSSNYLARLYSNQIERSSREYEDTKNVTVINIMSGDYKRENKEIVNNYIPKNKRSNKELNINKQELVLVRFDLVNKKCYDENEDRFIRWLRIMSSDNIKSMKKYSEGDKIMESAIRYLERYNEELNHTFEDRLLEERFIGEENGLKKGMKEEKIANAKNFLGMGVPVDIVVRGTGLSLDEVVKIEKEIKNL